MVSRLHSRWCLALFLVCIGLIYYSLADHLGQYHAFWSPDSGARFALLRNLMEHGSVYFPTDELTAADPHAQFHPLGDYAVVLRAGTTTVYSPHFPLLAIPGYLLSGTVGLVFPAILGGIGTLWWTYLTAGCLQLRHRGLLLVTLGLTTPLVLYSAVFWDHSLQMMLVAATGYCLARGLGTPKGGWIYGAGALIGIGVWFQELFLVLLVSLVLSAPWRLGRKQGLRIAGRLLAGCLPVMGAWIAVNLRVYGVPGGPHTQGPNQVLHPYHLRRLFDPVALFDRAQVQLVGRGDPLLVVLFVALLGLYVLTARSAYRAQGGRAFLLGGLALLAAFRVSQVDWSHGLLETTPLLLPALVPVERESSSAAVEAWQTAWFRWLQASVFLFGTLVILNPLPPGMDWGSRYLLTVLPVLALLAVRTLARVGKEVQPRCGEWSLALLLLVLASGFSQWKGWQAIKADLTFSRSTAQVVRRLPAETLVTDVWWLGPELTLGPGGKRLFLLRPSTDDERLTQVVGTLRLREFSYLGSREGAERLSRDANNTSPPFHLVQTWQEGEWTAAQFVQE